MHTVSAHQPVEHMQKHLTKGCFQPAATPCIMFLQKTKATESGQSGRHRRGRRGASRPRQKLLIKAILRLIGGETRPNRDVPSTVTHSIRRDNGRKLTSLSLSLSLSPLCGDATHTQQKFKGTGFVLHITIVESRNIVAAAQPHEGLF